MNHKNIDVIFGGQFGSEGKGLVAGHLGRSGKYGSVVSTNSAQAGHTVYRAGVKIVTRHIPSAAVFDFESLIYLAPGCVINPVVLLDEINMLEANGVPIRKRLAINELATIVTEECIYEEESEKKWEAIGSTCEGVGAALARRVRRRGATIARDHFKDPLEIQIVDKAWHFSFVDSICKGKQLVLLEGSQGWGLSVYGPYFPFCTSRDTSVAGIVSAAQLPLQHIRDVYGVYRTFPIRVAGNSGPLTEELTWDKVAEISGYQKLQEITTVTKRVRRVGAFDFKFYVESILSNGVTRPVFTFMNYLDHRIEEATVPARFLSNKSSPFLMSIAHLSERAGLPLPYALSADPKQIVEIPSDFWTRHRLLPQDRKEFSFE